MKKILRLVLVAFFILCFFVFGSVITIITPKNSLKRKLRLSYMVSMISRWILKFLSIEVEVINKQEVKSSFIVANHLSYIDIFIICGAYPCAFVTSIEMKKTLFLGQITSLAGCIFVERRSRDNIHKEIQKIKDVLDYGLNIVVFPEATSTNGEQMLPFKRSLFESAMLSGCKTRPLTLNYKTINGEKLSKQNRDLICWYADMEFAPHLLTLAGQGKITSTLMTHDALDSTEFNDTKELRDKAFDIISKHYEKIV
ncbi:MAG: 1-acyl-sn-glycerol-3-phosphate acyltransferase [Bacteriovoracaceae bacterium]|jgi:1-acyl-sn-glycerol-3-phosphate acyltransferase|nr:1-acyl-sn-glycerol-3-phosphate acyltransferase [Bacteriovoracaceae bacterium]